MMQLTRPAKIFGKKEIIADQICDSFPHQTAFRKSP